MADVQYRVNINIKYNGLGLYLSATLKKGR